jgi:hypothetical protein
MECQRKCFGSYRAVFLSLSLIRSPLPPVPVLILVPRYWYVFGSTVLLAKFPKKLPFEKSARFDPFIPSFGNRVCATWLVHYCIGKGFNELRKQASVLSWMWSVKWLEIPRLTKDKESLGNRLWNHEVTSDFPKFNEWEYYVEKRITFRSWLSMSHFTDPRVCQQPESYVFRRLRFNFR